MKITADRARLLAAVQAAGRAAASSGAQQALQGVQLEANGHVELRCTNGTTGLRVSMPGEVQRPGTVLAPAALLTQVVKALPSGTVEIEQRPGSKTITVRARQALFELQALRDGDFPRLPDVADFDADVVELPAELLARLISRVMPAASSDDDRPLLQGIRLVVRGADIELVATDSYRLAVASARLPDDGSVELQATIPAVALAEVGRLLHSAEPEETVSVAVSGRQIVIRTGGGVVSSRLIDGAYPNWRALMPTDMPHHVLLDANATLETVKRIGLLAVKNTPLKLSFADGELTVTARSPDVGEADEALPVPYHGEPMTCGFNSTFLRDGLAAAAHDGQVRLNLATPLRPILLTPPQAAIDGIAVRYLLMPQRLAS